MSLIESKRAQTIVRLRGWSRLAESLAVTFRHLDLLPRQREVLSSLRMPELFGIDAELVPVIRTIPDSLSWGDGIDLLREHLHALILAQLEGQGPTLFFDVDAMMRTKAAVLVPEIVHQRLSEVRETVLKSDGRSIRVLPLHLTHYGHQVLTTMGVFSSLPVHESHTLAQPLHLLELPLNVSDSEEHIAVMISEDLRKYIFEDRLSDYILSFISRCHYENRSPVGIVELMHEFKAVGFEQADIHLKILELQSKSLIEEKSSGAYVPVPSLVR